MILKPGVSVALLTADMDEAAKKIEACYQAIDVPCIVTSGDERDTLHRGKPLVGDTEDPHYCGKALDFRIWTVPEVQRAELIAAIRSALGPAFVVLWESRGQPNEHLHVQAGYVAVG